MVHVHREPRSGYWNHVVRDARGECFGRKRERDRSARSGWVETNETRRTSRFRSREKDQKLISFLAFASRPACILRTMPPSGHHRSNPLLQQVEASARSFPSLSRPLLHLTFQAHYLLLLFCFLACRERSPQLESSGIAPSSFFCPISPLSCLRFVSLSLPPSELSRFEADRSLFLARLFVHIDLGIPPHG